MKNLTLHIKVERPVDEVFMFAINPENTPKWIDSITKEITNEWPVKVGSIYKNLDTNGIWSEYMVLEFKENKLFTLKRSDGNYHVQYKFTKIDDNTTNLEYYEWMKDGELESPFSLEPLKILKQIIENS